MASPTTFVATAVDVPTIEPTAMPKPTASPVIPTVEVDPVLDLIPAIDIYTDPALASRSITPITKIRPNTEVFGDRDDNQLKNGVLAFLAQLDLRSSAVRGTDLSAVKTMIRTNPEPTPDLAAFKQKLVDASDLVINVAALEEGQGQIKENVHLVKWDAKKGLSLSFMNTSESVLIPLGVDMSTKLPDRGYTLTLRKDGSLNMQVFLVDRDFLPNIKESRKQLAGVVYSDIVATCMTSVARTLGYFENVDGAPRSWQSMYATRGFETRTAFPDIEDSFDGEKDSTDFSRPIYIGPSVLSVDSPVLG